MQSQSVVQMRGFGDFALFHPRWINLYASVVGAEGADLQEARRNAAGLTRRFRRPFPRDLPDRGPLDSCVRQLCDQGREDHEQFFMAVNRTDPSDQTDRSDQDCRRKDRMCEARREDRRHSPQRGPNPNPGKDRYPEPSCALRARRGGGGSFLDDTRHSPLGSDPEP